MHITLIEDDIDLGQAVADHLRSHAHVVQWLKTAAQARLGLAAHALGQHDSDLVLLDLGLPDGDGTQVLAALRAMTRDLPVLVISARDQISDRIRGLASGADDYLVKPFDLDELLARIDAVARRYALVPGAQLALAGGARVDFAALAAQRDDATPVALTAMEWSLLRCLASRPNHTWSKVSLARRLYEHGEESDSNTLEVLVSRLRKKLGSEVIATSRQLGYRLERSAS